jgi:hypothetical protein
MFDLDLHDQTQRGTVERAVESLPGVVAARLVAGYERPVDELHVLVTIDRGPKQVVRDVQSLLFTRFDLNIDHRVISVVQLDDDDPIVIDQPGAPTRVALTRVSVTQAASETTVTVVVADAEGLEHVGMATGAASVAGQRAATSEATLNAIREVLGETAAAAIRALQIIPCEGVDAVLAVVDVRAARSEMTLTGSALVRRGETDAIARALLDALNRVIQLAGRIN